MARPHPVIDQTPAEVCALNPFSYPCIVFVRNQQRQSVIVQDSFYRRFPRSLLLPDLY